jgi:hypothetical protein
MKIGTGVEGVIRFWLSNFKGCNVKRFMKYAIEMSSGDIIYAPSFMTIGSGIQVTL